MTKSPLATLLTLLAFSFVVVLAKDEPVLDWASHPFGFQARTSNVKVGLSSDFIYYPAVHSDSSSLSFKHQQLTNFSFLPNHQLVNGNLITVSTVSGGHFQILGANGRCCQPSMKFSRSNAPCKERTSTTAMNNNCIVATNAGFFDVASGYCLGNVISNGKMLDDHERNTASFGFVDNGKESKFVMGYLNKTDAEHVKMQQLVQGSLWLVRDGKSFVNESIIIEKTGRGFCEEKAPRVAIGHDIAGQLMILQVDGYEPTRTGLDVYEMTYLAQLLGFHNAINLDGGGSATTYIKGYPTLFVSNSGFLVDNRSQNQCSDGCSEVVGNMCPNAKQGRCERHVTTIVCLK